ncbi:MAG: peptidylprolyl isomerase [Bacteroidales bacterium]|nr:peptidylprolyl isomerase [Bacteroidales bacterium]
MAAIGKIRQKSGLLIIIVGVALAAFVMGDLFQNMGQGKMKYDPTVVALINDEKISSNFFSRRVEQGVENQLRYEKKTDLTSDERYNVQLQIWEQVRNETVLRQQCELIGLAQDNGVDQYPNISIEEFAGLLNGSNPHPSIAQSFTGQDGKFDPTGVSRYLSQIEAAKQSTKAEEVEEALNLEKAWQAFEESIKMDQLSNKYYNLISKSYFVPKTIAKFKNQDRNDSRSVRFAIARYGSIADSVVEPTDADYQAYYDEHKTEFKAKDETRQLSYILWNVTPSNEDIMELENSVAEMQKEFSTIEKRDLPSYVNRNSDQPYDSSWRAKGTLSPYIDSIAFTSEIGTVYNSWRENNMYHIARLVDVQSRPDSMKASHILISYAGALRAAEDVTRTKIAASALADSLLEVAKKNKDSFAAMAMSYSNDPSAKENSGDLDWFADGQMVPQFNEACLANNVGDIVKVETDFGYHILYITGKLEPKQKVQIAQIDIPITFSQDTYEKYFNEASSFVSVARDAAAFDTVAANLGLNIMSNNELNKMTNGIPGIENSREIVQWVFNDNLEVGQVSDVFDFNDKLVVALYNHQTPKGFSPLDDKLKERIKTLVMRDLKYKRLLEQFNDVKDLNAVAKLSNVPVDSTEFFTFSTYSLKDWGPEPNVQGRMFSAELNKFVGPVKGDQGIYFFVVTSENKTEDKNDSYKFIGQQEVSSFKQRLTKDYVMSNAALRAIVDIAEIEDSRQYFY